MSRPSKCSRIVDAAFALFKVRSFADTTIDDIVACVHISKGTLYKYFPSKSVLIVATLEQYQSQFEAMLATRSVVRDVDPVVQLVATVAQSICIARQSSVVGCLIAKALNEFIGKDDVIVEACGRFRTWQTGLIHDLVGRTGTAKGEALARKLLVAMDGLAFGGRESPEEHEVEALIDDLVRAHLLSICVGAKDRGHATVLAGVVCPAD